MKTINVLAFDFGASSGRAIIGSFDGKSISLTEVHRFANNPIEENGRLFWDIDTLWNEVKTGIKKAAERFEISSIGVDTWGVDFGLLSEGKLLQRPLHYRNAANNGKSASLSNKIDLNTLYSITGTQILDLNTVCQLLAIQEEQPELLKKADCLLMMPDLFGYLLTGKKVCEITAASTTGIMDINAKKWNKEILSAVGVPEKLFCNIVQSGVKLETLTDALCKELNVPPIEVVTVCGHDTGSAVLAVPAEENEFLFLSCGTWSLFGTELNNPIINCNKKFDVTNEAAFGGKIAYLKNLTGLWLLQQLRRQWNEEGNNYSFSDIENLAAEVKGGVPVIDTDAPEFKGMDSVEDGIISYCKRTGQIPPGSKGEFVKTVYQSLAQKYNSAIKEIETETKKHYNKLYIVGGGAQSSMLCQTVANICKIEVAAGASEATAFGNVEVQLIALGSIKSSEEARKIIKESNKVKLYKATDGR